MPHVLILRPIHPDATARLEAAPGVTVEVLHDLSPASMAEALPRAEAIIVRIHPITREVVAQAPKLRIVARHGVGYDAVDVPALTERGIVLTITPDANAVSVAEHALMLMLACARRVTGYDARIRVPLWGSAPELPTFDLQGRTLLLVGFGRIGSRTAALAAAFGMRVLVWDPVTPAEAIRAQGFEPAPAMGAALAEADIVSLHCPSNDQTRHMVNAGFLAAMKRGAVLINTARGTLVVEDDLAEALRSGQVAAAGLDVYHDEPVETPIPLLSAPNLILTPHTAAATAQGLRRMAMSTADSVLACFARTLDPGVVVNREVLGR
jgi:D-3-phosphoglycerate dehydrogenase